jgi:hypothetical protein
MYERCVDQELMSMISGRLPAAVDQAIRHLMATYSSNITSVLCQFPSQQVCETKMDATNA